MSNYDGEGFVAELEGSTGTYGNHGDAMWNSLARAVYPKTAAERIALSAHLYQHHGVYSQGLLSAVSYFVTELEVHGKDLNAATRHEITRFLNTDSGILDHASEIGAELLAYGTIFMTIHVPFERLIVCPECHSRYRLRARFPGWGIEFSLNHSGADNGPAFHGKCPNRFCPSTGEVVFNVSDVAQQPSVNNPIRPVLLPPQIMRIIESPTTANRTPVMEPYKYSELVTAVEEGIPEVLFDTRMEYLQSLATKNPIQMDEEGMKCLVLEPSSAEKPRYKGWGVPAHLAAFPYAAQLVLLEAYNEVITAEFSVPRRVISPPAQVGTGRARNQTSGTLGVDFRNLVEPEDFLGNIQSMMRDLRADPSKVGVSPFPFEYQVLGAEAGTLVTQEMMEYYEERLLRAMGILPELYKGGINAAVASPTMYGFRLFERKWRMFLKLLNDAMDWLSDRYGERMQWPAFTTRMASTVMISDPMVMQYVQTGVQTGDVSKSTFHRILGIDNEYEREMVKYENEILNEELEEESRDQTKEDMNRLLVEDMPADIQMQQMQGQVEQSLTQGQGGAGAPPPPAPGGAAGGAPGGAVPPSPAPSTGADLGQKMGIPELQGVSLPVNSRSIDQMKATAESIAGRILTVPVTERSRITERIKGDFPDLHLFVMQSLDQMEHQGARAGIQAVRQGQL